MNNKKVLGFLFISTVLTLFGTSYLQIKDTPNQRIIIITVDDVTPAFTVEQHQKIFSILDSYNVKATLFVVPFWYETFNVTNPEHQIWIDMIKGEVAKGYEVAQEGYTHTENEFAQLNYTEARARLLAGKTMLEKDFGYVCGWRAPYWSENYDVIRASRDLHYCYDANRYVSPYSHAWIGNDWVTDYVNSQIEFKSRTGIHQPFIIVLHTQKMDNQGFTYLEEFLKFAVKQNATFKTYRDVYGGNPTFLNIPQGINQTTNYGD